MEVRIYFEGNKTLRSGFKQFFSNLCQGNRQIEFIAAKDGISGYRKAARTHPHAWNILLKDSEGPVPADVATLCTQHGIDVAHAKNVFWMVELMESWFLADPDALAGYYGRGFSPAPLGTTNDVERVPKSEVLDRIERATHGRYNKATHATFLLERLNPQRVQERAPHCRMLFDAVRVASP